MWGQLGDITFELWLTPEELTTSEKEVYAQVDIYGTKPSIQHTKTELKRIPLKLKLFRTKDFEPKEFTERIRELKNSKEPQPLFVGDEYMGDFIVEEIKTIYRRTDMKGNPIEVILEIYLLEATDGTFN